MRIVLFVALAGPLLGTSYTWVGGTPAAGPYPWNTAANWAPAGFPNSNMDSATFGAVGSPGYRIIQVNGTFTLNNITLNNASSYSLLPQTVGNSLILYEPSGTAQLVNTAGSHFFYVPFSLFQSNLAIFPTLATNTYFYAPISESSIGSNIRILSSPAYGGSVYFGAENTFTGTLTIEFGKALLIGDGALSPLCGVTLSPTSTYTAIFDISGINADFTTIADLTASQPAGTTSAINLGNKNLTFGDSNSTTFEGSIIGAGGSLTKQGSGTFTLASFGGATYSGPTTILEGTFKAATLNSFSPNSDFILDDSSILDLAGFNNTIRSLSSNTIYTTVTDSIGGRTLTILNGGNYFGTVSGDLTLNISGTLNLYHANTYTGLTILNDGGVLGVASTNALGTNRLIMQSTSTLRALNTLTLPNSITLANQQSIFDLQSYNLTLTGNLGNALATTASLYVMGEPGSILVLSGNSLYNGTTTLASGVTVQAGGTTAFSPGSNFILQGSSTLDTQTFSNSIDGLSGSTESFVNLGSGATLTIGSTGGDFEGAIQGAGGLNIEGPLTLSGINTFTGGTFIGLLSGTTSTLSLVGQGALASSGSVTLSAVFADAIFDITAINGDSRTIGDLTASAPTGSSNVLLGDKNLTFGTAASTNFDGIFTGLKGSLSKQGTGIFNITATGSNYWGATTIYDGTIKSGIANAFSPNSPFILYDGTVLDIAGFSNTIQSLTSNNPTSSSSVVTNSGANATLSITSGGSFGGNITGSLALTLTNGTLNLYGAGNSYTGNTNIQSGATIGLGNNNVLGSGILFINSATLRALGNFSLSNEISVTGPSTIDLQSYNLTLSGNIANIGSFTILSSPQGTLTMSGANNTYLGSTTLTEGVTLKAGSSLALSPNSAFTLLGASILDLNGFSNTINTLSAPIPPPNKALVTNSGNADATLTLLNGGVYGGKIVDGSIGTTGITVNGGTLIYGYLNSYSGTTTLNNSAILQAAIANAFSPNSLVSLHDSSTLDLNSKNNTIAGLEGTANTNVILGNNATLTIAGGLNTTYAGAITNAPCGSLTITGGTNLTLTGTNTYCGVTNIINGTLNIQGAGSLSPNSAVQVQTLGTLTLGAFNNDSPSLTTSGTVVNTDGIYTISPGAFTQTAGTFTTTGSSAITRINNGVISGGQFIVINDARLTDLGANPTLSITGGVVSVGTTCTTTACTITSAGCNGSDGSFIGVDNISFTGGLINTNGDIFAVSSYTQGPNATLNLILCNPTFGTVQCNGPILLDGTLVVTAGPLFPAAPTGFYHLISKFAADVGVPTHVGEFASIQLQGFSPTANPRIITSPPRLGTGAAANVVTLYFSGCDATWDNAAGGNWNDDNNWVPPCVPGITIPPESPIVTNDAARFVDVAAASVTVHLAYQGVLSPPTLTPASPVLYTLQFNASTTSYTINPYTTSKITFDATSSLMPPAQLLVDAGSHTINAPIVLNMPTDLSLADGAQLTLGTTATLQSGSSPTELFIFQSSLSTLGTGKLVNNSTISPYSFHLGSATVQNNTGGFISPTGPFTMDPIAGQTAHLINSGTITPVGSIAMQGAGTILVDNSGANAKIGSTGATSTLTLGGSAPITINNSGTAAIFGNSSSAGDLLVNGTGPIALNNTGASAIMGPSGPGGKFIVSGTGTITLNNTGKTAKMIASGAGGVFNITTPTASAINQGLDSVMGATGAGGNVTISAGSVQNKSGAILRAGDGGLFTLSGGTITNDLTSKIGALTQNLLLSGGSLNSSGAIYAFNYTQQNGSLLTLNLTSVDVFGFVQAEGLLTLDNAKLTVNALPGFTATNTDILVLLEGDSRSGTFSTVNFTNFPSTVIPTLEYLPNAVELVFTSLVPGGGGAGGAGSAVGGSGSSTNMSLSFINSMNLFLDHEIMIMHEEMYKRRKHKKSVEDVSFREEKGALMAASSLNARKQEQLFDESKQLSPRACRIYLGPTGSTGSLRSHNSQLGFDFTSSGVLLGIDRFGEDLGGGVSLDYKSSSARFHHHAGHFTVDQLHASGYGLWVPSFRPELSLGAIIGGAANWYDFHRPTGTTRTPLTAISHPDGHEFDALINLQYLFSKERYISMPASLEIVPLADLQYVRIVIDRFHEKNAGAFDLMTEKQVRQSLRSYLGTRLIHSVSSDIFDLRTEFDLGWQREYLDHDYNIHVAIANTSTGFTVPFYGLDRNSFLGGIDLLLTVYDKFQVEVSYDLQWNPRFISNDFYFGIGGKF